MDSWTDVRRKARECHRQALEKNGGDRRAVSIIAAALEKDDLEVRYIDLGKGTLGSLDRSSLLVNLSLGQTPIDERVVIAHEIGHFSPAQRSPQRGNGIRPWPWRRSRGQWCWSS